MRTSDFSSPTLQSGPLSRGAASNDPKRQIGYRPACVVGKLSVEEIFEVAGRLFYARQLSIERHSNSSRTQYVFDWNRRDL